MGSALLSGPTFRPSCSVASSPSWTTTTCDAITGLGTTHFDVDGWDIDIIIGGSQKALMIPPGLAYCAISERAWKRMESAKSPRYYFDFRKERKAAAKGSLLGRGYNGRH